MVLRALVTRPKEDAEKVARSLRERGIEPVIEPMLSIRSIPNPAIDLVGVQALLFTSANGVRAFAAASKERALPVFAVGEATADAARLAGFDGVETAGGDVTSLASLVSRRLDPEKGALFHGAGNVSAGDLAGSLKRSGFMVKRTVLYEAVAAAEISPVSTAFLRESGVIVALFFSPRTAATFVTLIRKAGLDGACRSMVAICLSPAVAEATRILPWRELRTAASPRWPAMLDEIDAALRHAPRVM